MPYVISFTMVIGKKDSAIHVVPKRRYFTVCGIAKAECVDFIHIARLSWCSRCRDAYQTRDSKEFALINDKPAS